MQTNKRKKGMMSRVKGSITNWLGIPVTLTSEDFWSECAARQSNSGQRVDYNTVMTLSTVWSCVRLISESISALPLTLYQITPKGRVPATAHPLYNILRTAPNTDSTAVVHWEAQIAAMLLRGWGRAEKLMFGGRVVGLRFLDPCRLARSRNPDGTYRYTYKELDGTSRVIPP